MHVFILGPPSSGVTSVATILKERYGICHVTPSDAVSHIVEHGETAYGASLRQLLSDGRPVPDALLAHAVAEATRRPDCAKGFIMDGFPRSAAQARLLHAEGVRPDAIVLLDAPKAWLLGRETGRWLHAASGRTYHAVLCPPRVRGRDDGTHEALVQRAEDAAEAVEQRVERFNRDVAGLRRVYGDERLWHHVNGAASVVDVHLDTCKVLDPILAAKQRRWWSRLLWWRGRT